MAWKEEYRNALLDMSANPPDLRKIVKPHIPLKLYKYGSFQSQFWGKVVYKGQIYFSSASEFNDPFDCKANFDYYRVVRSGKLREELLKLFPGTAFENISEEMVHKHIIEGIRKDTYVFCFSEVWDSILMWAHYANNYNGYCIEYETNSIKDYLLDKLYPVLYEEEYIDITESLINLNVNSGMICYLTKAKEWYYEKEWRIIRTDQGARYQNKAIKAIYLGNNCTSKIRNEILQWGKENNKEIYSVRPSKTQYKLEADREV